MACTWALDGTSWREVNPVSPDVDTAGATLISDTRIGRVIIIGSALRPNPLNVLWVLNGSTWGAEPPSVLAAGTG